MGVEDILEAVIARIPPPKGDPDAPLKALIIDSWFDNYVGVVMLVRVVDGTLKPKDKILFMSNGNQHLCEQVGVFTPKSQPRERSRPGRWASSSPASRNSSPPRWVTPSPWRASRPPAAGRLQGDQAAGVRGPVPGRVQRVRPAPRVPRKLRLNDASLQFEPEVSQALGFGFRCGFLGLLHMEIVQERLEREFDMNLITTAPTVVYEVLMKDGTVEQVSNPSKLPDLSKVEEVREPIIKAVIFLPQEYVGPVITLCNQKRGAQVDMLYHGRQVQLIYDMPMNEVVMDFFDKLKSVSRGYASLDYEFKEYRAADLVKLDVLVSSEKVDALSIIVHRANSQYRGRELVAKLRELIPRQMFDVAIQAAIGSNIVARETIKALRKNVLAKCYGGDITRKKKLLEKQKEGKKRMKQVGNVEIPQEAFLAVLRVDEGK
jgi:GTP-binding protein LepA